MVRKVTLSVKIQAKVNFEGMGAKPLTKLMTTHLNDRSSLIPEFFCSELSLKLHKHRSTTNAPVNYISA